MIVIYGPLNSPTLRFREANFLTGMPDRGPYRYLPRPERIGFLGSGDDIEISLWQPLGGPRVVTYLSPDQETTPSIAAIVVSDYGKRRWPEQARQGLDAALSKHRKVGSVLVTSKVSEGPIKWSVYVQLPSAPTATDPCGPNVIW
jgi:hypothetical protein